jgi:hypothetical protein
VLRQALQSPNILANKFGRAVVVIDDRKNAIYDSMIRLQQAHDDAEDYVRHSIDEMV